jgi:uncharacterized protein
MFDMSDEDYQLLLDILREYLSGCKVYAFGSRVNGNNHQWSDLDLYIEGDNPISPDLKEKLSESDLPIFVDVIDTHEITPEFRDIIIKSKQVLVL